MESISEIPETQNNDIEDSLTYLLGFNLREESKNMHSECIASLRNIISNILAHPEDPKYRRIRKNNGKFLRTVGSFESALFFLSVLGFESVEEQDEDQPEEVLYLLNLETEILNQ